MKHFSFLMCAAMLAFVACDKDDETPYSENATLGGTLISTMANGSSFSQDDATVDFNFGENELVSFTLKGVKFAAAMPMTVDLQVDSVPFVRSETDGKNTFTIATIVPKFNGQPFPRYTFTNLTGEFLSSGSFSISFVAAGCNVAISNVDATLPTAGLSASGKMVVTIDSTTTFTKEDVVVNFKQNGDVATIEMLDVKFAEAMPLTLDMTIDSVSYSAIGDAISFSGDNIVPQAMGGPFPKYTITKLNGTADQKGKAFKFTMMCGSYPVSYEGTIKQ